MTDGTTSEFSSAGLEDLFPEFGEAPEATPETPAPEAPAEQPVEAPQPEAPEAEAEAAPEPEAPVEEQPRYGGGKFKTPEALDQAYLDAQRALTQRAQDAARARTEAEQLRQSEAQARQLLEEVKPLLEAARRGELDLPEVEGVSQEQQLRAMVRAEAERVAQQQIAPFQQQQEQAVLQQRMSEINTFRSKHPDAAPHEEAISYVVQEYRFGDNNEEVFPPTADNLEIAYTLATRPDVKALVDATDLIPDKELVQYATEAADNPALAEVVRAMPGFLERGEAGMTMARKLAGMPAVVQTAQNNAAEAQKQAAVAARKAAHVERDSEANPTGQSDKPEDFLAEALRDIEAKRASSVFI